MGPCLGTQNAQFVVYVKTGDRKHAGTDANVKIKLHDVNGVHTDEMVLDNFFRNDFESGKLDVFPIDKLDNLKEFSGRIGKVEFWRDNAGLGADWYVDKIVVENRKTNEIYVFPVFRWIRPDFHYVIKHLDTSLPQFDHQKGQRQLEIKEKRRAYETGYKFPGAPAQVICYMNRGPGAV